MKKTAPRVTKHTLRRVASAMLALILMIGLLPASGVANAAHWTDEYVNTLVDWGVMRGDISGNMNADKEITRAEFVAMINRAFGYTADTEHPFDDVSIQDWYNNDIGMGYNMGYFKGVSETNAAPNSPLTREQAVVLIGRNLLLDEKLGETLGFSDSRTFSDWSRSMVESAIDAGIISGYDDGSFKPQQSVTRGEVAAMLVRAIGTMVNTEGTHELGGVYGNVMISTSGVKLKNTTIAGDLYVTGGVELGDVLLENVTVLGKIVISGTGESQKGDSSIILRNVEAGELVLNSISDQFVTLRAEGNTQIDFTSVKTSAHLDDQTEVGDGLLYIELNGKTGMTVSLAGNIEEVLNCTDGSALMMAQGTAQILTMDEKATNATLEIKNGATINKLNLDVATSVTGKGDVDKIYVNASGSTIEMLPDKITIRPGLDAEINGETMDSQAGQESSSDPRILSGYPKIKNLAPNSVEILFSTNKAGTIHWALTSLVDGPAKSDELLEVKDYNTTILQQGTISVTGANEQVKTKISNLLADGSYYVSAVLVDSRGNTSPVKYVTFTTPDGSAPAFASGYPELTQITKDSAQMTVMPTKTSKLYYAVLPKGASAPTIADFKAGAIGGDLGNCPEDGIAVTKNVIDVRNITAEGKLTELTAYELYLCLIDADNGKDSGVQHLSFTTIDGTDPELTDGIASAEKTGIKVSTSMNEDGTIYWVAVKEGQEYPVYPSNLPEDASDADKMKVFQLQVINGAGNVIKSGKATAKANADVSLSITGLAQETSYDIYYVAQDKAGNCSEVKKLTQRTLDTTAPTVKQSFNRVADDAGNNPHADTDITLTFSEPVRNKNNNKSFYELYTAVKEAKTETEKTAATKKLVEVLTEAVQLWDVSNTVGSYQVQHTTDHNDSTKAWVDYSEVKIDLTENGEMTMTFAHGTAVNLVSGGTYRFVLNDIMDTSQNAMRPNAYQMDQFTTVFAQVNLASTAPNGVPGTLPKLKGDGNQTYEADADIQFWMMPQSTDSVNSNIKYDIWFETTGLYVKFDVYCRVWESNGTGSYTAVTEDDELSMFAKAKVPSAGNDWRYLGCMEIDAALNTARSGLSSLLGLSKPYSLNTLKQDYVYEFLIDIVQIGSNTEEKSWSDTVKLNVSVPAGNSLMTNSYNIKEPFVDTGISNVANPNDFSVSEIFIDELTPGFKGGHPTFNVGDTSVKMNVQLDRAGTLYYVIAPMTKSNGKYTSAVVTEIQKNGTKLDDDAWFTLYDENDKGKEFPKIDGTGVSAEHPLGEDYTLVSPNAEQIVELVRDSKDTSVTVGTKEIGVTVTSVLVTDLQPTTTYIVYAMLRGQSQNKSNVYMFQFTTAEVDTPTITLNVTNDTVKATTSTSSDLYWAVFADNAANGLFGGTDTITVTDSSKTMTVLEALTNSPVDSKKSYFDLYATEEQKETVRQLIMGEMSPQGFEAIDSGNNTYLANVSKNISPQKLSPETNYYIIATAKNSLGDTYGFKGAGGIRKADVTPPDVQKISTGYQATTCATDSRGNIVSLKVAAENPYNYSFSGSVSLSFTEQIYQLSTATTGGLPKREEITSANFESKVTKSDGVTITNVSVNKGTIYFEFSGASLTSFIVIFSDGSICDANENTNQTGGARLQLSFGLSDKVDDSLGYKKPQWNWEWTN